MLDEVDAANLENNRIVANRDCVGYTARRLAEEVRDAAGFVRSALAERTEWKGLYGDGVLNRAEGLRILNIGSGIGQDVLIAAMFGAHVTAVDIAENSVRLIGEAAAHLGVASKVATYSADVCAIEFPASSFDLVIGNRVLHHLTHNQEQLCLARAAEWLTRDGEARFFENAENSVLLERLRWAIPMRDRPSILWKKRFAAYRSRNPSHPSRSNSARHYRRAAERYFGEVTIQPFGGVERLHRLFQGRVEEAVRHSALAIEALIPQWMHLPFARRQAIRCRYPKPAV